VQGEAVDPVEGVEELLPLARTGVGRGADMDAALRGAGDTSGGDGRAYEVTDEAGEAVRFVRRHDLFGVDGEEGVPQPLQRYFLLTRSRTSPPDGPMAS